MNNKNLISLIIPCFNVEKYLSDIFKSIKNQTYQHFEVIFVDDGSTDNTLNLLNDFKKNNSKIYVIHQNNKGLSGARNSAIKIANGEYIYMVDPDDIIDPKALEILHNIIHKYNADAVICNFKKIRDEITYEKIKFNIKDMNKITIYEERDEITSQYLSSNKFEYAVWNKLFKHDILKQIPTYPNVFIEDCKFLEDVPFCVQYFSRTNKVILVKQTLYYYRQRNNSLTHDAFNEKQLSLYKGWKDYNCVLNDNFPKSRLYVKIKYCIDDLYILFLMRNNKYSNKELIKEIYNRYKNNLKYCIKGKKLQWYKKYLLWTSKPFIYLFARKIIK